MSDSGALGAVGAHTQGIIDLMERRMAHLRAENAFLLGLVAGLQVRCGEEPSDWIQKRIDLIYKHDFAIKGSE